MNERRSAQEQFEFANELEQRFKTYALRSLNVFRFLPLSFEAQHLGRQFIRSATSSAANYRAARRSRRKNEFYAKISIVIEELDESIFWLELMSCAGIFGEAKLKALVEEGTNLLKLLSRSRKNLKSSPVQTP